MRSVLACDAMGPGPKALPGPIGFLAGRRLYFRFTPPRPALFPWTVALCALRSAFPCPSPSSQHLLLGFSLLANPPTQQLWPLMVARYVLYPEAYVWGEGLTVEVGVVNRHDLASILTWQDLVGDLL